MSIEDAKEMIELVAKDGLVDVEAVLRIIDRIDNKESYVPFAVPDSDSDFSYRGNGPKDCYGNPVPYCGIDKSDSGHPNFSKGITTCTCCDD